MCLSFLLWWNCHTRCCQDRNKLAVSLSPCVYLLCRLTLGVESEADQKDREKYRDTKRDRSRSPRSLVEASL